ncbi:MAG: ribosome silencing factor [Acidimicrobiales bacterium]
MTVFPAAAPATSADAPSDAAGAGAGGGTGGVPRPDRSGLEVGSAGTDGGRGDLPEATRQRCTVVADAAASKGGLDTVVLVMGDLLSVTEAFVITSGTNVRQVRTIVEEVERQVKASGGPGPLRVEGLDDARWVLMDYGDVLVHVFLEEARSFYDLEHLWSGAPRLAWSH